MHIIRNINSYKSFLSNSKLDDLRALGGIVRSSIRRLRDLRFEPLLSPEWAIILIPLKPGQELAVIMTPLKADMHNGGSNIKTIFLFSKKTPNWVTLVIFGVLTKPQWKLLSAVDCTVRPQHTILISYSIFDHPKTHSRSKIDPFF